MVYSMNDNLEDVLNAKFPGRKEEICQLISIFREYTVDQYENAEQRRWLPNVLLYGARRTGKTAILLSLLKMKKLTHVFVDCRECYTNRLLFSQLLRNICLALGYNSENVDDCFDRVDSMLDFIITLKNVLPMKREESSKSKKISKNKVDYCGSDSPLFIVLKNIEHLSEMHIRAFSRLSSELLDFGAKLKIKIGSVAVIFISRISEAYRCHVLPCLDYSLLKIYFSRYTKGELIDILQMKWKEKLSQPNAFEDHYLLKELSEDQMFFTNFSTLFLANVYNIHRDLFELEQLMQMAFVEYIKPIKESRIEKDKPLQLCNELMPFLKSLSSFDIIRQNFMQKRQNECSVEITDNLAYIDLPYYSKYLLVAAFFASYIPAKYDSKIFSKSSSKRKKKNAKRGKQGNTSNGDSLLLLLGAKSFSFNRLLAIFFAIIEQPANVSACLLAQVSSLVDLKLLLKSKCSGSSNEVNVLEKPQFKCDVQFDTVKAISRTLNFEVEKYLAMCSTIIVNPAE